MEIGHNVLHGQWDWTGDPKIHSIDLGRGTTPPRRSRGRGPTTRSTTRYTNILGHDRDLGYGILRVDPRAQEWAPRDLIQPLWNLVLRVHLRVGHRDLRPRPRRAHLRDKRGDARREKKAEGQGDVEARSSKQVAKDYLGWPAAVRSRRGEASLAANLTANVTRNLWSHAMIFRGDSPRARRCSTSTSSTTTRPAASGTSARCSARPTSAARRLIHLMSGNLSHQIEHHLFPDLPSNRYARDRAPGPRPVRPLRPGLQRPVRSCSRSAAPGTASSACRCPTAGWPRPTAATWRSQLKQLVTQPAQSAAALNPA